MRLRFFVFIIGTLFFVDAQAQIDPSSALLLNRGNSTSSESAIDSGRYTTRPRDPSRREEPRPVAGKKTGHDENADQASEPPEPVTIVIPGVKPPAQSMVEPPEEDREPVVETARIPKKIGRRLNLIELSFAPGYLYSDSSSDYFYRRYSMSAPMLSVDANVWLKPKFALSGSYMSTLSGHVNDSLSGYKSVPATYEWFTAGLRFREFFGYHSEASALIFGIDYYDSRFRVPSDASYRQKLNSAGVRISLESELAVTPHRSWLLGVSFAPKLRHLEEATNTDAKSGGNVDTNAVALTVGGRIHLDHRSAMFWKLSHSVEKSLFSGEASVSDPQSSIKPVGVSVTNSITLFLFGYTWGN